MTDGQTTIELDLEQEDIDALVKAGFFEPHPDGGYQFTENGNAWLLEWCDAQMDRQTDRQPAEAAALEQLEPDCYPFRGNP